jgi:hypothetical protein
MSVDIKWTMKSTAFWDVMLCSLAEFSNVSDEHPSYEMVRFYWCTQHHRTQMIVLHIKNCSNEVLIG